jgi:hypothetical protein
MKKPLLAYAVSLGAIVSAAGALALAASTPAPAITFPSLTTIYVASGVYDDGDVDDAGIATSVHCSNVSGQSAQVRVLVLDDFGGVEAAETRIIFNGATRTFSTHGASFLETPLNTGSVTQGVVNVESTQSAVFCSAMIVDAASSQNGVALHMVRVNAHPGAQAFAPAATPSPSTTFPSLATIYVASGVYDDGGAANAGAATAVHCSNVSGQNADVRILVLGDLGGVEAAETRILPHGRTRTFSKHLTSFNEEVLNTGFVLQGVLNVESTQSAVFCSAMIVDAADPQNGVALHMVRVNGHPGTIE